MEPLKPEDIERIIRDRPDVTHHDIQEYERLLAERFQRDPNDPGWDEDEEQRRIQRIYDLHHKIFGFWPEEK